MGNILTPKLGLLVGISNPVIVTTFGILAYVTIIGVATGGRWDPELGTLTFFKAGAWPPHFCISYCVSNIVTDNFILI